MYLVKKAQQPGPLRLKIKPVFAAVPHLQGASHKLIAARPFHAIHAEIGAANAHRVLGGPGAGGIIFGGHQTMAGVQRRRHRGAQINIAQTHDQIIRLEDNIPHLLGGGQAVDALNKINIARTPGRVIPHRLHINLNGLLNGGIIPAQRQINTPRGYFYSACVVQFCFSRLQKFNQLIDVERAVVEMHLQGANAGGQIDDAMADILFYPAH